MTMKYFKKSPRYAKVPLLLGLASLLFYTVIILGRLDSFGGEG